MDDLHIPESIGTDTAEYRKLKQYLAEKSKKQTKFDPKKAPTGNPDEVPEDLRGRVQYFGHMFTREQLLGIVQNELRDAMRRRQPGRAREAAVLARDLAKQYYGKNSSIYAATLVGVGMAEKLDLNYAKALKLLQQADDRYEAIYGAEHPFTARIQMNMGTMYHQMGDLEEKSADRFQRWMVAEAALEVSLEAAKRNEQLLAEVEAWQQEHGYGLPPELEGRLGKDARPGAGASINDPAMVLRDEERERARAWAFDEVGKEGNDEEQLRRRRLAARGGDPGPLPPHLSTKSGKMLVAATMQGHGRTDTAMIKTHLAVVKAQLTGPRAGETLARQAIEELEAIVGPSHALVSTALNNLGFILKKKKDFEGSERAYRRVLEYRESRYQPKHADLLMARANLFQMYKEWGKMD